MLPPRALAFATVPGSRRGWKPISGQLRGLIGVVARAAIIEPAARARVVANASTKHQGSIRGVSFIISLSYEVALGCTFIMRLMRNDKRNHEIVPIPAYMARA